MESLPLNSLGARQLTGSIFNINSINKEYREKEVTNQIEGPKSVELQEGFTALKEKGSPKVDEDEGKKTNDKKEKKQKRKVLNILHVDFKF